MKILITGGMGFVGSHLVSELSSLHQIHVLDNFDSSYVTYNTIHRGKNGLDTVNDIEKKHRLRAWLYRQNKYTKAFDIYKAWSFETLPKKDFDLVINCGSLSEAIMSQYYKDFTHKSIITGLENIKKTYSCPVLHFSSSMVYGEWNGFKKEDEEVNPESFYGLCKAKSESLCSKDDIIIRPIHIYGMGDGKYPIWMNIERQLSKNSPVFIEKADCIYIYDLCRIIKKVVDTWIPGVYNLSSNQIRNKIDLETVYPKKLNIKEKLGPTGKERGLLDISLLKERYNPTFMTYKESLLDYYNEHDDFSKKQ